LERGLPIVIVERTLTGAIKVLQDVEARWVLTLWGHRLGVIEMKTGLFLLCLLCASTALAQTSGALSNEVQPFQMSSHERRATQQTLAKEQSLLESSDFAAVEGERPLWEVQPLARQVPLGDVARELRKEHETVKKAGFVRND
jgi:hypothetical protein